MEDIDVIDRKILHHLQRNADLGVEALGEIVGLSRNACWRRVKQLQKNGVIKRQVALLDADKLGLGLTVFIQVRTNQHEKEWLATFSQATQSIPEILGVYRMSGDLDYLIKAKVETVAAYDHLYQKLVSKVPLSDVSASFVMEEIKETTELPVL